MKRTKRTENQPSLDDLIVQRQALMMENALLRECNKALTKGLQAAGELEKTASRRPNCPCNSRAIYDKQLAEMGWSWNQKDRC